jgi:hypothetical protein
MSSQVLTTAFANIVAVGVPWDSASKEALSRCIQEMMTGAPKLEDIREPLCQLSVVFTGKRGFDDLVIDLIAAFLTCVSGGPANLVELFRDLGAEAISTLEKRRAAVSSKLEPRPTTALTVLAAQGADNLARQDWMLNLSISLAVKFRQTRQAEHLQTAIRIQRFAIARIPRSDSRRTSVLTQLVMFFSATYTATWAVPALNHKIEILRELVKVTPEQDEPRTLLLGELSDDLDERHHRRRNVADLEEAVSLAEEAVQGVTRNRDWRTDRLVKLVAYVLKLAKVLQNTTSAYDFGRPIRIARQAVDSSSAEDLKSRARLLWSLADLLQEQYWRSSDAKDLNDALSIARESLELTPQGDSARMVRLEFVAALIEAKYSETENVDDLYELIRLQRLTLEEDPTQNGEDFSMRLFELSTRLELVYRVKGDISIVDEGIELANKALDHTPINTWGREDAHHMMGTWYEYRFRKTGDKADLEASHLCYRRTFDQVDGIPFFRISASARLMRYFAKEQDWAQAYAEACRFMPLMPLTTGWAQMDRLAAT